MADVTKKPNTIKSIGKKVANNGDASDYEYIPIGADSDNVDRPDGSTVEESLSNIEIEKVEIIPVESLPITDIKIYPFIYALVKPRESKGTFYEYKNNQWIKYGNSSAGLWVGTKEECAKDFDNIENGTIVIIINKKEDSGETHTHDYVYEITKPPTYSETGIKKCTCFLCGHSYTENIPALIDSINPAGIIRIGDNEYVTWKDTITFDTYYKDNQTVTIEATDNETGVKEIAYHLATTGISDSNIETVNWTVYDGAFEITPNNNYIIYARITDNADNVTYICSDGIVMDNIPPVFEGLEDGGTYSTGTVLTVEDGATLTVNGEIVELVDNTYTFTEVMDNCILSITDKAGNSNSITIKFEHTCQFIDGICSICGKNEYEEIELTSDNLYMTGLTSSAEDYDTPKGELIIPSKFEFENKKYKVVSINCDNVKKPYVNVNSLILPNTLTTINSIGGFRNCEYVTIPESVTNTKISATPIDLFDNLKILYWNSEHTNNGNLAGRIFYNPNNKSTYKLIFGDNITTIPYLFNGEELGQGFKYTGIHEIEIKNDNAIIRYNTFYYLPDLEKINLPKTMKNINNWTFASCTKLTNITIPDSVTSIGSYCFCDCRNLIITIPNSVTRIDSNAFKNVQHIYYNGTATGAPWGALAIN